MLGCTRSAPPAVGHETGEWLRGPPRPPAEKPGAGFPAGLQARLWMVRES